ncbi:chorismate--pyruvate lyase family protein [Neptunicella sp.]|uniref:chorismate--pyruvate lyase family protein n=1 Tax=Neptunicella sp. TaxID=2125986 RepID=UPI003F691167
MTKHFLFPINYVPQWFSAEQLKIPDPVLKNWLLDTGSLTERLQANSRHFRLELLGQEELAINASEQTSLGIEQTNPVVREVLLQGNQQNWVYARSLMSRKLCDDASHQFGQLGNTPLGKVIFNDPRFTRQPFEICRVQSGSVLHQKLNIDSSFSLWGRRSVFSYQEYKLMVAEIFLPNAPAYKNQEI